MGFARAKGNYVTGKLVRFDDLTWDLIKETAKSHDMTANFFIPLIIRNYLAKRWPLDLIPEPKQVVK